MNTAYSTAEVIQEHPIVDSAIPNLEMPWYMREKLLTFSQVARHFRVHPSTIWRWANKGRKSKRGACVHLASRRLGGRNVTSMERVEIFIRSINDRRDQGPPEIASAVPALGQSIGLAEKTSTD